MNYEEFFNFTFFSSTYQPHHFFHLAGDENSNRYEDDELTSIENSGSEERN